MSVPANDNKPTKWHLIVGTQTRHSRNETEAWSQVNAEVCHDYMNFSEDLWRSLGSLGSAKQRASKYGWTCGAAMHYASRYNFWDLLRHSRGHEIHRDNGTASTEKLPCYPVPLCHHPSWHKGWKQWNNTEFACKTWRIETSSNLTLTSSCVTWVAQSQDFTSQFSSFLLEVKGLQSRWIWKTLTLEQNWIELNRFNQIKPWTSSTPSQRVSEIRLKMSEVWSISRVAE